MRLRALLRRLRAPTLAAVLAVLLAALLAGLLAHSLHAYRNPAHVAQWLALLQFCR